MIPVRHLVVDNEAAQALASTRQQHRKRAQVLEAVMAANGRRVVPTAVRVEAGWRRSDPLAAVANRQIPDDDVLDAAAADRSVELRRAVPLASVVDASIVVAAERVGGTGDVVEVLTSDVDDLRALAMHSSLDIDVVLL